MSPAWSFAFTFVPGRLVGLGLTRRRRNEPVRISETRMAIHIESPCEQTGLRNEVSFTNCSCSLLCVLLGSLANGWAGLSKILLVHDRPQ
jgi:hypothetical protein